MKNSMKRIFAIILIITMLVIPNVFASSITDKISGDAEMLEDVVMGSGNMDDEVLSEGDYAISTNESEVLASTSPLNRIMVKIMISFIVILVIYFLIKLINSFRKRDSENQN